MLDAPGETRRTDADGKSKMTERYDVLIVGGGHGGAQAAAVLRQQQFAGSVAIISEEECPPYDRPPLSKDYLSGEKPFERMMFRTIEKWGEMDVDLLLGQCVVRLDAAAKAVGLRDGRDIGYKKLIWATGGRPRRLGCAGADVAGVHAIRNRSDVDRLMNELPIIDRVIVIGGGYIGLEAAAVLTKLGKKVIVLEALDRVLARVAGEPLSRFYEAEHRAHGVDVQLGVTVDCIESVDGRASGVRLSDGSVASARMIIVGIGISPEVAPLLAAGAAGNNGVKVDGLCRTSLGDIYAIGDCAEHQNVFANDEWIRLESVQNANDQAATAAMAICGIEQPYRSVPWFWSHQYDLRLQTVGLSRGYDEILMRGDPKARSFALIYLCKGKVIALDCVNATRDYVQGRALVANGAEADRSALADPTQSLKNLVDAKANKADRQ